MVPEFPVLVVCVVVEGDGVTLGDGAPVKVANRDSWKKKKVAILFFRFRTKKCSLRNCSCGGGGKSSFLRNFCHWWKRTNRFNLEEEGDYFAHVDSA